MKKNKGIFPFRKHSVGELLDGEKERKRKESRLRGANVRKMHRALGMLLAAALVFNTLPASGLAVSASEGKTGLCEHHTEHTVECGYREAQPCTHEHGEECYKTVTECVHEHTDECYPETDESTGEGNATASGADGREPANCTHVCSEESGCITKVLDCHHEHDESCGYSEEDNIPCGYVCRICLIENLIAALPDAVTEDNAEEMRAQLDEILALYRELMEDEQEQIDLSRCYALQEALDAANAPMTADAAGTVDVTISAVAKAEKDGNIIGYYDASSLADAFAESGNAGATFTLLDDVERNDFLEIQIDCTLDLNGHNIHNTNVYALCTKNGTTVTIRGQGQVISDQHRGLAVGGTVTLEGGTFIGASFYSGVSVSDSGVLNVTGKDVVIEVSGGGCGLELNYSASAQLSAGTYKGVKAIQITNSSKTLADLLGTDGNYAYYGEDSKPIALSELEGQTELTGPVTVQECKHEGVKPTANNDGTHSLDCPCCGYTGSAETCSYMWDEGADTGTCACGSALTVSVTGTDALIYDGNVKEPAVTVTRGGTESKVLTEGTDYTVGYNNNKAAGIDQAAVTVTGKTFHGSCTHKFSIGKAIPKITWDAEIAEALIYTGEPADITSLPTVTLVNNETFRGTINYYYVVSGTGGNDGNSYISGLPVNAGTYRIKAAIAEQDNYTAAESTDTLSLTINKAEGTLTVPETPVNKKYGDMDFTLECSADGDGEISYASDKEEVVRVLADGTVQIKGLGEATVTVSLAEGTNHTAAARTVTIIVGIGENAPNMPDSAMNVPDSCLKVGDVVLPENWEWRKEDREKPLIDETAVEAVAVYTGADRDNFENITAAVAVISHKAGDDILYTGTGEKAPTCTEDGLGHRECTTCHTVVETGIVVEALGHSYTSEVTKEPTTSEEGEMTHTCSRCGDTYTETIPKEIPDGLWISGLVKSVPYTGSAVRQEGIRVYHGSTLLREKTEYTISYKGNTNAGTAQLIVTGKGNYKGKCTAEFTIEPVDLKTDGGISVIITTVTETGRNLKPTVTVTWNGKKLKEKKDYTLSYETGIKSASEEGYDVVISGKGNYTGDIERKFYVKPRGTKLLNKATVKGIKKSYEYQSSELNDGQNGSPEGQNAGPKGLASDLENITVKIGTTTLAKEDYTVRTENTDVVGTGYVVIKPAPTSIYAGEKRIAFNITGTNIRRCFITGLARSYPYTGGPIMPEIEVYTGRNGTGTLIPSDAYTVRYSNYTNQGKATVTVTGIPEKGCLGSITAVYSIGRLNLATEKTAGSITVTMPDDIKYAKGGAKPRPVITHSYNGTVRILREGVDYTLKYSNNTAKYDSSTAAGSKKPTLRITGTGNYTGTIAENFDIVPQDIGKLQITAADKAYNSKKRGSYYYSVPKVYDFDGKLLKSGRDYTVQYTNETTGEPIGRTDTVENGTQIRVTVTAKENSSYMGTLGRTYSVRDAKDVKDISKVKNDKIAAQQYTGSAIKPEVKLYTLTGKTKNYLTEEDYEIIGYYNNIKRGNATVLIRGAGAYSGVKSITFKITSADNKLIWIGIF